MKIGRYIVLLVLILPMLITALATSRPPVNRPDGRHKAHVTIAPTIPKAKRNTNLVFLERADRLFRNPGDSFLVVSGNVEFSKGGMKMYTDSAHYYDDSGSFEAFGNVCMEQGDTLFVYADDLLYDGLTDIAVLHSYNGKKVRLINRDVKLETDTFTYDLQMELASYATGGVLTDRDNRLESIEGEYSPATKEANFRDNVILTSLRPDDELRMVGDQLYYNTVSHIAEFSSPTVIISKDGRIDSDQGTYNTETRIAELFAHSLVTTAKGSTLEGDTLFYDRVAGYGWARGNMALKDTVNRKSILTGEYGYYDEVIDSAFVTGRALGKEFSQGDTLYIHGLYLKSIRVIDSHTHEKQPSTTSQSIISSDSTDTHNFGLSANPDNIDGEPIESPTVAENISDSILTTPTENVSDTMHIITAWPRVRFFRIDMQGVCDSLVFTQNDTTVRMYYHPIVWSDNRQIYGNRIDVHLNDSTVDRADLPDFGFMSQQIETDYFNQLTGKTMTAWFVDGEMNRALVSGNVEGIVYPEENDSTINKFVNFQTANLEGWFENRNIRRLKMWPETSGEAIPLYLAKYSQLFLQHFKWYTGIRPTDPESVMENPPEMEDLMSDRPIPELNHTSNDANAYSDTPTSSDTENPTKIPDETSPRVSN